MFLSYMLHYDIHDIHVIDMINSVVLNAYHKPWIILLCCREISCLALTDELLQKIPQCQSLMSPYHPRGPSIIIILQQFVGEKISVSKNNHN